jgi:hypothetical protein
MLEANVQVMLENKDDGVRYSFPIVEILVDSRVSPFHVEQGKIILEGAAPV